MLKEVYRTMNINKNLTAETQTVPKNGGLSNLPTGMTVSGNVML